MNLVANLDTGAFGGLTREEKRSFVSKVIARQSPSNGKRPSTGLFNPARTKLLESFRLDKALVRGTGHLLYDAEGREYLDFLSQYGALPFGQNPPALWEVLRQAEREQLASMVQPLVPQDAQRLAEKIAEITPGDLGVCTFTNSGAEAVEAAIKLARVRTGRPIILSTINSFHGKTLGALSATGRPMYQKPFGAPMPHFEYVPFGDADALAERLACNHDKIAAFIVEPIQGEGGVVPAPTGYLAEALALCKRYGVLSIVDEIQTGLGRTGSLFALPKDAGAPDILVLAKALGGGLMPIGACITTEEAWDDRFGLLHSSTFSNNNLACRVAMAVIDLLLSDQQQIVRHVAREGQHLINRLEELQAAYPSVIKAVRGQGFMVGLEFHHFDGNQDSATMAYCSLNDRLVALFSAYLFNEHRIVTAPMFNSSHVMRLQPPFTVGRSEVDRAVDAITTLCDALDRKDYYQIVHHQVSATSTPKSGGRRYSTGDHRPTAEVRQVRKNRPGGKFAFLVHYTTEQDYTAFDPSLEQFTREEFKQWRAWLKALGPGFVHRIDGIESPAGHCAEGWLIALPMLPADMLTLRRREMLPILENALSLADDRGADVLGLGGFTSIVSRGGESLTGKGLAITSGNTLTTVIAIAGIEEVMVQAGRNLSQSHAAVVGATGAIGRLASLMLSSRVAALTLVGNPSNPNALGHCRKIAGEIYGALVFESKRTHGLQGEGVLARRVREVAGAADIDDPLELASAIDRHFLKSGLKPPIQYSMDPDTALSSADLVVVATNSDSALIRGEQLKEGAIVCDVARPPNVADDVVRNRNVLVFDGGLVQLPQPVGLGAIGGLPPGVCWGCLGETILLALEGEKTDYSIGSKLTLDQADHLAGLAKKHGFRPAPPQWYGRRLTAEDFRRIEPDLPDQVRRHGVSEPAQGHRAA